MSEGERPTPAPRPRQTKADEADRTSKAYENYTLPTITQGSVYDHLNAQLFELKSDPLHRVAPVPAPRVRTTTTPKRYEYENAPETAKPLNNQKDDSPARSTGAIRKAPNIPVVKNNLDETDHVKIMEKSQEDRSLTDFDVVSQTSSTSGKSDSKFSTPSPG